MSFLKKLFGKQPAGPFMEHPTGDFDSALGAMEDAVGRLRSLSRWDRWITFTAQGAGEQEGGKAGKELDGYEFVEVRMLRDRIDVGPKPLDLDRIVQQAEVTPVALVHIEGTQYSVAQASPTEVARILDAIFRVHGGLRPFADEEDDYAVGAEW